MLLGLSVESSFSKQKDIFFNKQQIQKNKARALTASAG
jgi:hypothetical protein